MNKLFLGLALCAAAAACRRSELQGPERQEGALVLAAAQSAYLDPALDGAEAAVASKASETAFEANDTVGVFVHQNAAVGASRNHTANAAYATADGNEWRALEGMDSALVAGKTYYATAYYPYKQGVADPTAIVHTVLADQSTPAGVSRSELMRAAPRPIVQNTTFPTVSLSFAHVLAKVSVEFAVPSELNGTAVTGVKSVTLLDAARACVLDLATGVVSAPTDLKRSDVALCPENGAGTPGVWSVYGGVVPPQTLAAGAAVVRVVFESADGDLPFAYRPEADLAIEGGKKLTLKLLSLGELCFASQLDLSDGGFREDMPLKIKVPAGKEWTLASESSAWLTLGAFATGSTYSAQVSGTGTGAEQTVYVRAMANNTPSDNWWTPRRGVLALTADGVTVRYAVDQNYARFVVSATSVSAVPEAPSALPSVAANKEWAVTGTLPSWLKISRRRVRWGDLLPTDVVDVSGSGYAVEGNLPPRTLYAVVDPSVASNVELSAELSYGGVKISVFKPAAIKIGNTTWATGNLVATSLTERSGCKVGAPTDGGLYFQFGSLIGWKGGADAHGGTGVGIPSRADGSFWAGTSFAAANEAMTWPQAFDLSKVTVWPNQSGVNGYFGLGVPPYDKSGTDIRGYAGLIEGALAPQGVGDACTYYLGDGWRIPNAEEQMFLSGKTGTTLISWGTSGLTARWLAKGQQLGGAEGPGAWFGPGMSSSATPDDKKHLFMPVTGNRAIATGSYGFVGVNGAYRNTFVSGAGQSYYFHITQANGIQPQGNTNSACALPVRCVVDAATVPQTPAAADYVTVNGLKWAKGNLVAVDPHNCKIGAPTDDGVMFQQGSLIGWKAGANGSGVGRQTVGGGKPWNGSAFHWASDVIVWPSEFIDGPTNIGGNYPINGGTAGSVFTLFNDLNCDVYYDMTQYPGFSSGALSNRGVGDVCSYYLGSPWRLPTTTEVGAIDKNVASGGTQVAYAGAPWTADGTVSGIAGVWVGPGAKTANAATAIFIPFSGCRRYGDSVFDLVNTETVIMTSSVGVYSNYMSGYIRSLRLVDKTRAFPVRCVSE